MEKTLVTYTQAVELKKLGFPQPSVWQKEKGLYYISENVVEKGMFIKEYVNISKIHYAPSIGEVVDWLRKEKRISLCSYPDGYQGKPMRGWVCDIAIEENGVMDFCHMDDDVTHELKLFKNYEDAILFGIDYCKRHLSSKQL